MEEQHIRNMINKNSNINEESWEILKLIDELEEENTPQWVLTYDDHTTISRSLNG